MSFDVDGESSGRWGARGMEGTISRNVGAPRVGKVGFLEEDNVYGVVLRNLDERG